MDVIDTRQQKNGRWRCNGTIDGYDYSFEGVYIDDAQNQMHQLIYRMGWDFREFKWTEPEYHQNYKGISDMLLKAQTTRLIK